MISPNGHKRITVTSPDKSWGPLILTRYHGHWLSDCPVLNQSQSLRLCNVICWLIGCCIQILQWIKGGFPPAPQGKLGSSYHAKLQAKLQAGAKNFGQGTSALEELIFMGSVILVLLCVYGVGGCAFSIYMQVQVLSTMRDLWRNSKGSSQGNL